MKQKKVYIEPQMAVMQLEAQAILAGSNTDQAGSRVNDPFYDDPGDNTIQIGFGHGTTKTPD